MKHRKKGELNRASERVQYAGKNPASARNELPCFPNRLPFLRDVVVSKTFSSEKKSSSPPFLQRLCRYEVSFSIKGANQRRF